MKPLYQTQATAIGGRAGSAASSDGRLKVQLDTPQALGGAGGEGTNPEQLFAAGYAACFLAAIRRIATERALPLAIDANVTATVSLLRRDDALTLSVTLAADLPGIDQETAEGLAAAAHARCPYSNAVRGNVDVRVSVG